jgi:hypothetical protein
MAVKYTRPSATGQLRIHGPDGSAARSRRSASRFPTGSSAFSLWSPSSTPAAPTSRRPAALRAETIAVLLVNPSVAVGKLIASEVAVEVEVEQNALANAGDEGRRQLVRLVMRRADDFCGGVVASSPGPRSRR